MSEGDSEQAQTTLKKHKKRKSSAINDDIKPSAPSVTEKRQKLETKEDTGDLKVSRREKTGKTKRSNIAGDDETSSEPKKKKSKTRDKASNTAHGDVNEGGREQEEAKVDKSEGDGKRKERKGVEQDKSGDDGDGREKSRKDKAVEDDAIGKKKKEKRPRALKELGQAKPDYPNPADDATLPEKARNALQIGL